MLIAVSLLIESDLELGVQKFFGHINYEKKVKNIDKI